MKVPVRVEVFLVEVLYGLGVWRRNMAKPHVLTNHGPVLGLRQTVVMGMPRARLGLLDQKFAEQLCDRVGILQKGELKLLGPTKTLIKDLTQREIVMSFKDRAPAVVSEFLKDQKPDELVFEVPAKMSLGDLISNLKINIENLKDVQIREGNLEDAIKKVLHE